MKFKYRKDALYIVAVSGGPDSMALLNMLYLDGYKNLVVCHVNYHRRKESNFEQQEVTNWANNRKLKIEVLDTSSLVVKGNFQAWARKVRYSFFKDMYKKYNASGLFVAHNQDDSFETYIIQKNKGGFYSHFGLLTESEMNGMKVLRPLLNVKKKDLLNYCIEKSVFYSIDSSNLEDHYSRNKIRHSIVEKMDDSQRMTLQKEIEEKNLHLNKIRLKVNELDRNGISIDDFLKIEDKKTFMYVYLLGKSEVFSKNITHFYIKECIKIIESDKPNARIKFVNDLYLVKSYGRFMVIKKPSNNYLYVIDEPSVIDNNFVSCDLTGDLSFIKVSRDSFPLSIRPAKKDEYVSFGNVKKKVNRVFIDYKIPMWQRNSYPVIVDKDDKVVFLPIYTSITQKNMANKIGFMIKW